MTVKSSISFTDRHHQFVKSKVDQGVSPSVSSLVAMGIEKLMREDAEQEAMLHGLADVIHSRMKTSMNDWVEMDESDSLFSDAKAHLNNTK